jgi:GNAT superfamily N-acetyltransferase
VTEAGGIRAADLSDIPELARLRWELYAEQREAVAETAGEYPNRFARFAADALASDEWHAWVVEDDGRLVAAMWLRTIERIPVPGTRAGPIGYLTNVYVAPERRNAGLGGRLLRYVIDRCREEGYSTLITWPAERSRPFYRRGGFDMLDEPFAIDLVPDDPL